MSSPGYAKNQRSLAHALAVETDPQLRQALAEDKDMKVVFINASESVRSKQQQKYEQMTRYRKALHLLETDFTIMSLQSLGFLCLFFHSVLHCGFFFCVLCNFDQGH